MNIKSLYLDIRKVQILFSKQEKTYKKAQFHW